MTRRALPDEANPAGSAPDAVYPISLCMIVRNEERFLRNALASVEGVVDEICIADTGSDDDTVAIATARGARVERIVWRNDFAWARNQALAMASGAWIFVLDADECLAPASRDELLALRREPPDGRGRWIRCRNFKDECGEALASTNAIVRIFPNEPAVRYRGALHEFVARGDAVQSLPAATTTIEIHHFGYAPAIMAERGKGQRNLAISRTASEAASGDPALRYNYAMSALLAGERDVARTELEHVVEITRSTPRGFRPMALTTLAGMYVDEGRPNDALPIAEECVGIVKTLPDGHFARGRALAALGRREEARSAFATALDMGGDAVFEHFVVDDEITAWKAHNEIGGTLVAEGRFAEAEQWLSRALAVRPAERTLLLNRARCRESQHKLAEARVDYRALLDTFRDENAALEYVNFVFRHDPADAAAAAVEDALPALGADYQRAFLASAAAGMLRVGRRGEAEALLRRVLAVGNEPLAGRSIIAHLAEHYQQPELDRILGPADTCA